MLSNWRYIFKSTIGEASSVFQPWIISSGVVLERMYWGLVFEFVFEVIPAQWKAVAMRREQRTKMLELERSSQLVNILLPVNVIWLGTGNEKYKAPPSWSV